MEELEYEREIAEQVLKELIIDPHMFELFPALSQSPVEAYLDEVRDCDIFIMILWKSLRPAVRKEYEEAVKRDKPILLLVKTLVENEDRDTELKKFLDILKRPYPTQYVRRVVFKNFRKLIELREEIRKSVMEEIVKIYEEPIHTLSRKEMYELGTSIIRYAQRRLYLFQKSPSLFLGARNYLIAEENKFFYEKEFLGSLEDWIRGNYKIADKEFLYLFSLDATKEELTKNNLLTDSDYKSTVKDRINRYKNLEIESGCRFKFIMIDIPISGPLIVGANRFAIWLFGGDNAVSISQENEKICDVLVRMLVIYGQKQQTASDIISALGL